MTSWARTAAVLIEVTFVSHYDGDATFPALHEQLSAHGFSLNALSEPFRAQRGAGSFLWRTPATAVASRPRARRRPYGVAATTCSRRRRARIHRDRAAIRARSRSFTPPPATRTAT